MADQEQRARLLLEIVASGAAETSQGLERLAGQATAASAAWERLNAHAARMERGRVALAAGIADVKSGNYLQQAREITVLAGAQERLAIAQKRLDLVARTEDVQSGNYLRRAQEMAVFNREQEKLTAAQRRLDIVAREGRFLGSLTNMQERLQGVARIGAYAFGILSVGIGGWVRSGLQGTAELQRFHMAMQSISREIANVFAPWIQRLVQWVNNLAVRFRALTGEQQESLRRWVAFGAAISATMMLLPRLIATLHALATAFKAVGLAQAAAMLGPIGLGVAAAGAVGVGAMASSQQGRDALAELARAAQPLIDAFGRLTVTLVNELVPVLSRTGDALVRPVGALARMVESLSPIVVPVIEHFANAMGTAGQVVSWFVDAVDAAIRRIADVVRGWSLPTVEEAQTALRQMEEMREAGRTPDWERRGQEAMRAMGREGGGAEWEQWLRDFLTGREGAPKAALTQAGAGFEDVEAIYKRIATGVSKSDTARTADATEQAAARLDRIVQLLMELYGWSREQAMERARGMPGMGGV